METPTWKEKLKSFFIQGWSKFSALFGKKDESADLNSTVQLTPLHWLSIALSICLVAVVIWGSIQQIRVWRWSRLLKDSKSQILNLQAEKEQIKWTTTKELAEQGIKMTEQDLKKVEEKIKQVEKKKKEIEKEVGKMTPSDLLKSFQEEGF